MSTCEKCGARLEEDDMFCPDCGAKILKKEVKKEIKKEVIKPIKEKKEKPAQPTESKSNNFIWAIVAIVVVIILFKACSGTSEPTVKYVKEQPKYVPPPKPEPKPEPKPPVTPRIDKTKECSSVQAKINNACWSCGLVSCGLVVEVKNTGSKPIFRFNTKAYINEKEKDESNVWDPLDKGASHTYYPYTRGTDTRMLEFIPVIIVNGDEVVCKSKVAKYGNTYGKGFPECSRF